MSVEIRPGRDGDAAAIRAVHAAAFARSAAEAEIADALRAGVGAG